MNMVTSGQTFRSLVGETVESLNDHPVVSTVGVGLGIGTLATGVEVINKYESLELIGLGRVVVGLTCSFVGARAVVQWWRNRNYEPEPITLEPPTSSIVTRPIRDLPTASGQQG